MFIEQVIFRNIVTGVDYLYETELSCPYLPRIGETITLCRGSDDANFFEGKVEDVIWSIATEDTAVFIYILMRPSSQ